jgi:putative copper resistance protein D
VTGRGQGTVANVASPPPAPTLWTLAVPAEIDVVALALAVTTAGAYVAGVRRLAARGRRWSPARTVAFLAGTAVLLVATQTGIARYDTTLFSVHVVQHVLLGMVAPVLIALGAPVTLALQSASPPTKLVLRRALDSRAAAVITHPLVVTALFVFTLPVLYFTSIYEWSLRYHVVHAWLHIHFVVVGVLFAEAVIGLDLQRHRLSHPARLGLVLTTVPLHAFLGVALLSSTSVIAAGWYSGTGRQWGASALSDQRTGAGILWAAGELFGLVLGAIVLARWMAYSEREARRQDRILDAGLPT